MKRFSFFHWQNLLGGRCPACNSKLIAKRTAGEIYHNCDNPEGCDFGISESHLLDILSRNDHPIRLYLTPEQAERLKTYLKTK